MPDEIAKPYSAKDAVKELLAMAKRAKAGSDPRAAMVLRYAADRIRKQIADPRPPPPVKEIAPEPEPEIEDEIVGIQTTWRHKMPTQYGLKPLLTKETT